MQKSNFSINFPRIRKEKSFVKNQVLFLFYCFKKLKRICSLFIIFYFYILRNKNQCSGQSELLRRTKLVLVLMMKHSMGYEIST